MSWRQADRTPPVSSPRLIRDDERDLFRGREAPRGTSAETGPTATDQNRVAVTPYANA